MSHVTASNDLVVIRYRPSSRVVKGHPDSIGNPTEGSQPPIVASLGKKYRPIYGGETSSPTSYSRSTAYIRITLPI